MTEPKKPKRVAPKREEILALLREKGPMTRRAISDALGWSQEQTHSIVSNTRRCHPNQLMRVVGYVHDPDAGRTKDQSLYAAEAGEDIPRKKINKVVRRRATQKRYREKNKARINATSRARRRKNSGAPVSVNPWAQLMPPEYRSTVTQIENAQKKRQSRAKAIQQPTATEGHNQEGENAL